MPKDFNALSGRNKPPKADFELGFDEAGEPRVWHVRGTVPALPFIKAWQNDPGRGNITLTDLIPIVLVADEVEPFLAMLDDPATSPLTMDNLQPFVEWLVATVGDRPTSPPSSSEGGSNDAGASSEDASSLEATAPTP